MREELEALAQDKGWEYLHQELAKVDPVAAERIHPNDPQRINRALEVYKISGKTMTELQQEEKESFPYPVKQFAFQCEDKTLLHERIEKRFHIMLQQGFEQEVKSLYNRGDLHLDLPSMRSVGYRQMWEYLDGKLDYEEMIFRGVVATRQLAKRQLTWLRNWQGMTPLVIGQAKENLQRIGKALS